MPSRRITTPLVAASACVALAFLVWAAALHTKIGLRADAALLRRFMDLGGGRVDELANHLAELCNPGPFAVLALIVVAWGAATRGMATGVTLAGILVVANVTTHLLKPILAVPREYVAEAAWPSGHSTAAASLALCAVIAAPVVARPLVATVAALFAAGVATAVVILGTHFPSDALGGLAVAGAAAGLGLAARAARAEATDRRRPAHQAPARARWPAAPPREP